MTSYLSSNIPVSQKKEGPGVEGYIRIYIWVEIFLDSIFSWFASECRFFGWIQTAPPPRLLYLCPKGKVPSDHWVNAMVWISSNPKNIARKRVQERVEIS